MNEPRALIAALHEINRTPDRNVARFTASLVGMFGSSAMLDLFLDELDTALATNSVPPPLRQRAANLTNTFIPQVAGFNGIKDLSAQVVTADELRTIRCDIPELRREGVRLILAAFMKILDDVIRIG
jgi:hypothetical protein